MTTPTLQTITAALDGIDVTLLRHESTGPRTVVTVATRTDFLAACQALDLTPQESPGAPLGERSFYATAGPLGTTPLLVQATSRVTDPDWDDAPIADNTP